MYMNNLVAYCKKLHQEGYSNKQIQLITRLSSSSISRILSGTTYKHINAEQFTRDDLIEDRKHVLDTLLEYHEIKGSIGLDNNNKTYIQILKKAGGKFDKIKELYYDISKKALRTAWTYPFGNLADFDGQQLNLTAAEIIDLLNMKENE
jgi:hypothetical protein